MRIDTDFEKNKNLEVIGFNARVSKQHPINSGPAVLEWTWRDQAGLIENKIYCEGVLQPKELWARSNKFLEVNPYQMPSNLYSDHNCQLLATLDFYLLQFSEQIRLELTQICNADANLQDGKKLFERLHLLTFASWSNNSDQINYLFTSRERMLKFETLFGEALKTKIQTIQNWKSILGAG